MHIQSNAWKRLAWLYRQLLRRMRALERAAERGWRQRVFMRVQVEMLQPRVLMSVTPSGAETQVNTTTTEQMMTPAIVMNPAGNTVVVWSTGDSGGQVFGQRYNSSGATVGGQFQINQNPSGNSVLPAIAMDTAGDFAVAWNGNNHSVYVRLYNASGNAVTGDTRVTSQETGQSPPAIAMTAGGTFVVAWEGGDSQTDSDGIYAQQFTAAGIASGAVASINTTTQGSQQNPSIAVDAAGDYAFSWTDHSRQQIKAAYWAAGGSLTAEVLVGDGGSDNEDNSQVRFNGAGNFVAAFDEGGSAQGIYARRYSGSSAIDPGPVLVSSANQQSQVNPSIAARVDGTYLIAWTSDGGGGTAGPGNDGDSKGVFAQAFTAGGAADGSEFQVNTSAQNDQQDATVAWSGNAAVIGWDSDASGSETGVFLQRYTTSGAVNQAPAIAVPASQTIAENTTLVLSSGNSNAISVSDSDAAGGIEQVTLTTTHGAVTLSGTSGLLFSSGSNGSAAMTFTGTLANSDAALSAMTFAPAANFTGTAQVQIAVNDLGNTGGGGAQSASRSLSINVQSPPTSNTFPGAQSTVKNTALVFSPENDNAVYIGSSWDTVQLTATHGTLTLSQHGGLSFSSGNGTNNTTMEFSGSLAAMDAAIAGMSFTPASGYTGSASLKVVTINSGLLGLGLLGSSSTSNIAITVTSPPAAANQSPAVVVPGAQTVAEGSTLILSGSNALTVSDADSGGAAERLTLTATSGTLTLAGTAGLTFSSGTGTGDASMSFTGTLASINTALASITFTPAQSFFGSGAVLATINDLGNTGTGGAKTASATIAINVTQVNQKPVVSVPAAQTAPENGSLAFSSGAGNPISVSDFDNAGGQEQVTLSTPNGTLSLGSMTGLTVNSGGNGQASIAVTGTLADLNTALGTLTFTPTASFSGATTVQVAMNDLGNTGPGGIMTASATVSIKVVQTLVVTTALDVSDGDVSSIANLLANPGPDGNISLREAILAIDNTGGGYGINFNIPGGGAQTIAISTALPTITNSMVIDGTSQPSYAGSPLIVLDGSGAPTSTPGLNITAANCVIRGLAIDGFSGYGINVSGVNGETIQSNYIGLDASGAAAGNSGGILLNNSLTDLVGGPNVAQRNVISANGGDGILVTGSSANVLISGNYIGTDPTGATALGNGAVGVFFSGTTVSTIGHDNVISGNAGIGVEISGGSNNLIVGNRIGTNAAGTAALGNGSSGIFLNGTTTCTIGKPVAGEQNVISGNAGDGIRISQSTSCTIAANFIGTDGSGAIALGNSHDGIFLTSTAANNTIGGTAQGAANVIANNVKGISISGANSTGDHIVGNSIFSNTSIGIDLNDDGPTTNTGAVGTGANMGMNSPVFTSTVLGQGELTVSGYVGSAPNQSVFAGSTIDIYSASISGSGPQAVTYIGSLIVDANGNFTGTISVAGLNPGATITGTATDTSDDTSELAVAMAPAIAHTPSVSGAATNENQQTTSGLVITPSASDNGATVYFQISNIIGGSLFLNDGVTAVNDGDFITTTEGAAGLKFTPAPNSASAGSFDVQASLLNADEGLGGSAVTTTIAVNAMPVVSVNPTALGFTEAQGPVAIDPQLTVSDSDSPLLAGATVTLIGYVSGEDALGFTNQNGITGAWNAMTGALTLSGAASPAQYQAALQTVTYNDTSLDPSTAVRTAEFILNDGAVNSDPADRSIAVLAVDTPPAINGPVSFTTLRALPLAISSAEQTAVTVSDVDANGGTEEITVTVSHGSLQTTPNPNVIFTGPSTGAQIDFSGTLSDINAALDGMIYTPAPGYTGADSLSITVNDHGNTGVAGQSTTTVSLPISVIPALVVNTVSDIVDGDTSAIQNLIENPGTDGHISLREAITALNNTGGRYTIAFDIPGSGAQAITLTSALPAISRSMTIDGATQPGYSGTPLIEIDGGGAGIGADGFNVQAIATVLTGLAIDGFSGSGIHAINANLLTVQGDSIGVTSGGILAPNGTGILLAGSNGAAIGGASASLGNVISGNTGDGIDLASSSDAVIEGNIISLNAKGVVISGGGADGNDLVQNSIHDNTSIGIDLGDDGSTPNTGAEDANLPNDGVNSPIITSTVLTGGTLFVTGYVGSAPGQSAFAGANIDLFLADSFASGQGERWLGTITADGNGNFNGSIAVTAVTNGEDITATTTDVLNNTSEFSPSFLLAPAHTPAITDAATNENQQTTGGLILTADPADNRATVFFKITNITGGSLFLNDGVTPVPENSFITAAQGLAGLKFTPSPNSAVTGSFSAQASLLNNDNGLGGSVVTTTIAVNAPPVLTASGTPLAYLEAQGNARIDPQLTVTDSDSAFLGRATVTLIGYVAGEDTLSFTNQHGITGAWNANTGVLTLTGAASPAQYQAALRSVRYADSSADPSTASRVAELIVNDGALDSLAADVAIVVTAVDNAPTISISGNLRVIENSHLLISSGQGTTISVADVDAEGGAEEVTLSVSNGTLTIGQDSNLTFANGTADNAATIDVVGTLADINAALDGMIYSPNLGFSGTESLNITVNDLGHTGAGGPQIATATAQVVVTPLPAPHITADNGLTTDIHVAAPITPAALRVAEDGASSDQLTFTLTSVPTQGTLELAGQALSVGGTFTQGDIEQGRLTYTPTSAQTNDDSFTFVVKDARGMSLPAASFQIHTTHFVPVPATNLPDPIITLPAPAPLPPPVPIKLSPIDLSGPTGATTNSDTSSQGQSAPASESASSSSTTGTLDSTSDRSKATPVLAANPGGAFVAPLLPRAPRAVAPNVAAAGAGADAPRGEDASAPSIDPLITSRGIGPSLGPLTSGGLPSKGNNAILAPGQNSAATYQPKVPATFNASSPLWRQLDTMQEQVTSERKLHIIAGTASLVSVGMSVMYFLWAVRAGSVLSSLLSSMPAWKLVDPLPILDQFSAARRRNRIAEDGPDEADDDETLESMVDDERKAA